MMGKFNLLDEPWISVMKNEKGETEDVSIIELFQNAENYIDLSGDSPTQDFAVLRMLLAVLHTVFSRYDVEGEPYDYFELDNMMRQVWDTDDDLDTKYYSKDLIKSWKKLWRNEHFSDVLFDYLTIWHDRFYLFDDQYPFYQVRAKDIGPDKISKAKASSVSAKTMNRLISESGNKIALFSPKHESHKEILTAPEIARWLITFQGYSSLSDKVIFGKEKYKASKGWLFDIGGVYLKGRNLYETLLLNLVLVHPHEQYMENSQKPCWEYEADEWIDRYFSEGDPDNLAELYTNWSRAIYIDSDTNLNKPFSFNIVKLPEIRHPDQFLEPMTTWRHNKDGENKDKYTPRKHQADQAMWRSFGLITLPHNLEGNQQPPKIMDWFNLISEEIWDIDLSVQSVSMKDDGNATSWMPVDEISDSLRINDMVLTDVDKDGWIIRITETVEHTKKVIGQTYRAFMVDIRDIRNLDSKHQFVTQNVEDLYYEVDQPFREWLSSIQPNVSKAQRILEWKEIVNKIVINQADKVLENASYRDYVGVREKEMQKNIITAYNRFKYFLNKE